MYDDFIFNKRLYDVYDCEGYTTAEVLSYFYEKINEFFQKFNELEDTTNERLEYLLGEGLSLEVAKKINELYENGKLADLLNKTMLDDLNKIVTDKLPYKVGRNDLQLYSNEIEIKKGDYSIYECQVVNSVNADRQNEIIFIKCSFPKSTVFSEKNITVMDSKNNTLPFEILKDTKTYTLSKILLARIIIFKCPLLIGSNEPGNTQLFIFIQKI